MLKSKPEAVNPPDNLKSFVKNQFFQRAFCGEVDLSNCECSWLENSDGKPIALVTHYRNHVGVCLTDQSHQRRGYSTRILEVIIPQMIADYGSAYATVTTQAGINLLRKIKQKIPAVNVDDPNNLGFYS